MSKEQIAFDVLKRYIDTRGNMKLEHPLEGYMQIILDYIDDLEEAVFVLTEKVCKIEDILEYE